MRTKIILFSFLLITSGSGASASQLAAFCTQQEGQAIRGQNIDRRLPIASVSKVLTTWWSLVEKGPEHRFPTSFSVTAADAHRFDVHIQGSRDPYFGRESLHFAISELNRQGIRKVRRLSFDENFKFYVAVNSNLTAASHYTTASPKPTTVIAQLESMGGLTKGWYLTQTLAKQTGTPLLSKGQFPVAEIVFQPKGESDPGPETRNFTMHSAPLIQLLKEMNRNSNNHAANQIFEHFGGADAFQVRIQKDLQLEERDLKILNGSGDRVDLESGGRAYNEASCESLLKVLRGLRTHLKSHGKDLQNVLAVSGGDPQSTVSRMYRNEVTNRALIAKTGTVDPAVTLAGLVNTNDGEIYFMYNVATQGTRGDRSTARSLIRQKVSQLIRQHNGGRPLKYSAFQFASIDSKSIFEGASEEIDELTELVLDVPIPTPRPEYIPGVTLDPEIPDVPVPTPAPRATLDLQKP